MTRNVNTKILIVLSTVGALFMGACLITGSTTIVAYATSAGSGDSSGGAPVGEPPSDTVVVPPGDPEDPQDPNDESKPDNPNAFKVCEHNTKPKKCSNEK